MNCIAEPGDKDSVRSIKWSEAKGSLQPDAAELENLGKIQSSVHLHSAASLYVGDWLKNSPLSQSVAWSPYVKG